MTYILWVVGFSLFPGCSILVLADSRHNHLHIEGVLTHLAVLGGCTLVGSRVVSIGVGYSQLQPTVGGGQVVVRWTSFSR